MIKAGIIGGAGYTAGELIRILINHPDADIAFVQSSSNAGNAVTDVHTDLIGETDLQFLEGPDVHEADVLFLCMGHGRSKSYVERLPKSYKGKIIDLSNDFRLKKDAGDFVYGLPELQRDKIKTASHIANPGCFATAIQLALLPIASAKMLSEVHIHAVTGSTGAGQSPSQTTHFSWRSSNMSVYKAFSHQHLGEIGETLQKLQPGFNDGVNFVPVRGDFPRGIMASVYMDLNLPEEIAAKLFRNYYSTHPFTHVTDKGPDLKMVVNTNKAVLHIKKYGNKIHIISMIDNLLKGASGQAVQNMNLIFGLDELTGLHLKPLAF
jgi:N-acetyl-gamma-glutamyl-phosphate reductase